ncbi:uncharacterized protein JCM6883_006686 [Sporobolomyces salmoneus]|uniref:uncharacterized protein n=1 Tax=Sporobolomyces salmoneus TaxID=183962 RepID=UPI00317CFE12
MRAASTLALLSSLALSAQASNSPAHQRQAIARRAEAASSPSATPAAKHAATTTSQAASSTVTPKAQKINAAAETSAGTALPLTEYTYSALSAVPYQVNPYKSERGPQTGYNICNSTTQGDDSECQTLIINSIDDFCLWGLPGGPKDLSTIGDSEAATVAYCVKDTHGSRPIPAGAITGLQWMKTKGYVQISGYIDQTVLGMTKDDFGGELDPHGADLLGNPLGGLVFSSGLPAGDNSTEQQVVEWNNFIGAGYFCFKLCDPSYNDGHNYCQNRYDLLGCNYNMPAAVKDGEFTECDGELQDEVGVYTTNGQVSTWAQSPEGQVQSPPYTPRVPSSSNCKTFQSTEILGVATTSAASASASGSASGSASASRAKTTASPSSSNSKSDSSTKDSSAIGLFLPSTVVALLVAGGAAVLF